MNRIHDYCAVSRRGFTLIELLVVIAVISVLAALIFPVTRGLKIKRMKSVAYAELNQMETAVSAYKSKKGFYPPDNGTNVVFNQLYFELSGTTNANGVFRTLDGDSSVTVAQIKSIFGIDGFMNSSVAGGGGDDSAPATRFITGLRPNQIGQLNIGGTPVNALLVCSVRWPDNIGQIVPNGVTTGLNPWRYVSNNPTNNPGSYDLWVDIVIDSRTNRISNWSTTPQVLP